MVGVSGQEEGGTLISALTDSPLQGSLTSARILDSFQASMEVKRMPRGDYRHREAKKPKKSAKKPTIEAILPSAVTVDVVKKGRKEQEEGEEER